MERHRLRAPSADGGVLADPPLEGACEVLGANAAANAAWDHDFQGRRSGRLRAMARQQVLDAARRHHERFGLDLPPIHPGPLVVTGHQPELFHPGVWVKNFAVADLGRCHDGMGLNLIVDDDIPKAASIVVPAETDAGLRGVAVAFDEGAGEVPYEDWPVRDEARFARFADEARGTLAGAIPDPILDDFWPRVLRLSSLTDRIGLRFAAARRELEASWGVRNWEVPLSALCETEAFLWFASHLLAHLPRFQQVHNDALRRYRALYHIRSKHHPVPSLKGEGDWLEAPFWAWRAEKPRRRPLLALQLADSLQLRIAGEAEPFLEIPLAPDREACCAVDRLRELPARGIRVRTRALTTTMFARLILGDLFLHGIGGAKYDELGDEVLRGFFGIDPPPYLTLSMTLRLGLHRDPATPDRLHEVERDLRAVEFNPDRLLDGQDGPVRDLIAAKQAAIAGPQDTRRQRVARFESIRRINAQLQPLLSSRREALESARAELRAGLRRNRVVDARDYAFVLHSAGRLRAALGRLFPM